jgi:hypothetical protein
MQEVAELTEALADATAQALEFAQHEADALAVGDEEAARYWGALVVDAEILAWELEQGATR